MTTPNKTFETIAEAKEFCLAQFCKPRCKDRQTCNPKQIIQGSDHWRNCLRIRQSLCPFYANKKVPGLDKAYLSYCEKTGEPNKFCPGKQCKELPAIVIEEEQVIPTFHFGASAPEGKDYKTLAGGDKNDVPF